MDRCGLSNSTPSAVRIPAKPQPRLGRSRMNNILRIGFRRTLSLGTALSASLPSFVTTH